MITECLHDYLEIVMAWGRNNDLPHLILSPLLLALDRTITSFSNPNPETMDTRRCSLLYLLALLCVSNLTIALTTWESIHQTIHTYPLAIDSKDFALLSKVPTLQSLAYKPLNCILSVSLLNTTLVCVSLTYLATGLQSRRLRQLHRRSLQPSRSSSHRDRPRSFGCQSLLPAPPRHHGHRHPQRQDQRQL